MNKDLQNTLFSEYPKLFQQKDLPKTETAMCYGICVADGWYDLLRSLCKEIEKYYSRLESDSTVTLVTLEEWNNMTDDEKANGVTEYIPRIQFTQVKQKFGSLTIYYTPHIKDDYLRGLVSMTRTISTHTCEKCGDKGKMVSSGWIKCLCDKCNASKVRWEKYQP